MRIVILESPYASTDLKTFADNVEYARDCMRDSLARGEAPMVSHLLYTQVLDDNDTDQREQGIQAGLAWRSVAQASVVYTNRGISKGMQYGIDVAAEAGNSIEYRSLPDWAPKEEQ